MPLLLITLDNTADAEERGSDIPERAWVLAGIAPDLVLPRAEESPLDLLLEACARATGKSTRTHRDRLVTLLPPWRFVEALRAQRDEGFEHRSQNLVVPFRTPSPPAEQHR